MSKKKITATVLYVGAGLLAVVFVIMVIRDWVYCQSAVCSAPFWTPLLGYAIIFLVPGGFLLLAGLMVSGRLKTFLSKG